MGNFIKAALGFIILISIFVGCVRSCLGLNPTAPEITTRIEKISFFRPAPLNLDIGSSDRTYFIVDYSGDDLPMDEIVFASSDENVATITFDSVCFKSIIYCYINAIGEGTATVYIESSDGTIRSEEIVVTVTESTTQQQTDVTENE